MVIAPVLVPFCNPVVLFSSVWMCFVRGLVRFAGVVFPSRAHETTKPSDYPQGHDTTKQTYVVL